MQRPNDWDQVRAYEERRRLPAGGYICEVKNVKETKSKTGKDMIVVAFDIAEGEYKGFFMDEYTNDKQYNKEAEWPFAGKKWILTQDGEGNTNRMLKGFVGAAEAENVQVQWGDNFCRSLQGAMVGVVFGEEEQEYRDVTFWRTVPKFFVSCEDIRTDNYRVPKKKALEAVGALPSIADIPDSFAAAEEEIPF